MPHRPAVPRRAATVMVLRDGVAGLEVLLLRRSPDTPFAPGAHVFPGGAVEDADARLDPWVAGRDDVSASATIGTGSGGLAYWVAAARELLEEAGVLLATTADGAPLGAGHPALRDLERIRTDVESGRRDLAEVLAAHDLRLALDRVCYVSHWITPEHSPRRYDTRFFVAAMPPHQVVTPDRWEATEAVWVRPADALAAHEASRLLLVAPTVASLHLLDQLGGLDEAMAVLAEAERRAPRRRNHLGGEQVDPRGLLSGDVA